MARKKGEGATGNAVPTMDRGGGGGEGQAEGQGRGSPRASSQVAGNVHQQHQQHGATLFRQGDLVEANYLGKGEYVSGEVIAHSDDGKYFIRYDNLDEERDVPAHFVRALESASSSPRVSEMGSSDIVVPQPSNIPPEKFQLFRQGDLVEANYLGKGEYVSGEVIAHSNDGKYFIRYDNLDEERDVPAHFVRALESATTSPRVSEMGSSDIIIPQPSNIPLDGELTEKVPEEDVRSVASASDSPENYSFERRTSKISPNSSSSQGSDHVTDYNQYLVDSNKNAVAKSDYVTTLEAWKDLILELREQHRVVYEYYSKKRLLYSAPTLFCSSTVTVLAALGQGQDADDAILLSVLILTGFNTFLIALASAQKYEQRAEGHRMTSQRLEQLLNEVVTASFFLNESALLEKFEHWGKALVECEDACNYPLPSWVFKDPPLEVGVPPYSFVDMFDKMCPPVFLATFVRRCLSLEFLIVLFGWLEGAFVRVVSCFVAPFRGPKEKRISSKVFVASGRPDSEPDAPKDCSNNKQQSSTSRIKTQQLISKTASLQRKKQSGSKSSRSNRKPERHTRSKRSRSKQTPGKTRRHRRHRKHYGRSQSFSSSSYSSESEGSTDDQGYYYDASFDQPALTKQTLDSTTILTRSSPPKGSK